MMSVIWLNGTVGAGKSAVGKALAALLPAARFEDGDDYAGPCGVPARQRWRRAVDALLRLIPRRRGTTTLIIAYPLDRSGFSRLRAICGRANRRFIVINLATPLAIMLRGRGGRSLSADERTRVRVMRSEGYHRRRFSAVTLPNTQSSPQRTGSIIVRRLRHRAAWAQAARCRASFR